MISTSSICWPFAQSPLSLGPAASAVASRPRQCGSPRLWRPPPARAAHSSAAPPLARTTVRLLNSARVGCASRRLQITIILTFSWHCRHRQVVRRHQGLWCALEQSPLCPGPIFDVDVPRLVMLAAFSYSRRIRMQVSSPLRMAATTSSCTRCVHPLHPPPRTAAKSILWPVPTCTALYAACSDKSAVQRPAQALTVFCGPAQLTAVCVSLCAFLAPQSAQADTVQRAPVSGNHSRYIAAAPRQRRSAVMQGRTLELHAHRVLNTLQSCHTVPSSGMIAASGCRADQHRDRRLPQPARRRGSGVRLRARRRRPPARGAGHRPRGCQP